MRLEKSVFATGKLKVCEMQNENCKMKLQLQIEVL